MPFLLLFGLLLVYLFSEAASSLVILCEGVEDLPRIMQFPDLHLTETLKAARDALKGESGIYCIQSKSTGSMSDIHVALAT